MALVELNINECRFEFTDVGKKYLVSSDPKVIIKNFVLCDDDINYLSAVEPIYVSEISGISDITNIKDLKFKIIK
jgi:hypothetical protein